MKISELANLKSETDWVLPPTLIGLIFGIMGAIATLSSAPIQQTNQPNQSVSAELATGINDSDFNKALPHILKWEGECSNHWADNGGKTYKGITWKVALKHGFKGDVCSMPDSKVYEIYYKDYWARVPKNIEFNRKLAHFNMIINGTSSRCLNKPTAIAMLDCQEEYYKGLADAPHFLDGWKNRNNYIKSVVE